MSKVKKKEIDDGDCIMQKEVHNGSTCPIVAGRMRASFSLACTQTPGRQGERRGLVRELNRDTPTRDDGDIHRTSIESEAIDA